MAAIDHDIAGNAGFFQRLLTQADMYRIVIGPATTAAQDDMPVAITAGGEYRNLPLAVDAEETVRLGDRVEGVGGDCEAAIGAIFEAHRRGQAAGHLPVGLRFSRAGTNGAPADQVLQVLGRDRVQRLGRGGQAQLENVQQQLPAQVQALLDLEGVIHVRVVDQALPAHRGARFFEIDPHHDVQRVGQLVRKGFQAVRVVHGRGRVMDGAGANHHKQPVVLAIENILDHLTAFGHHIAHLAGHGQGAFQLFRRHQHILRTDVDVVHFCIAHRLLPDTVIRLRAGPFHTTSAASAWRSGAEFYSSRTVLGRQRSRRGA